MGLCVKRALGKSSCVSEIPPVLQKNRKISVPVSPIDFATNHFTSKKFAPPPPSLHPGFYFCVIME